MRRRLQRWLPTEERLRDSRSLRWLRPLLQRPWLWQLTRRRVANGAAIGVFFGLLIPLLQIAAAAAGALLLRANLPVAAAATLVSNPVTYVPIWVAAHQTGSALLGHATSTEQARSQASALADQLDAGEADTRSWAQRLLGIGKPLMLGLSLFACIGAALTWATVHLAWIAATTARRRGRSVRRRTSTPPRAG
ncbi:MAG: DUF2062 domain-containing protein [Roseateles sp.]|uniref:DUF2062 domain-containing protein n=1 Tax=Roseateles sp. TaxID=1971397 RepID=UPI0040363DB8